MSRLTIDLSMSLDGYVAGPDPSQQDPLGVGGEGLHEWAFAAHLREADTVQVLWRRCCSAAGGASSTTWATLQG